MKLTPSVRASTKSDKQARKKFNLKDTNSQSCNCNTKFQAKLTS